MAATMITPVTATQHEAAVYAFSALNATDGGYIDYSGVDERITVHLSNTSTTAAAEVVLVQGDGIAGVADITVEVPASSLAALTIESSSFKITDGASDYKGHVHITGPATVSVAAVAVV